MTNATATTALQQLDKFALVNLSISIWSGQAKLQASELVLGDGGKLPSDKVAHLGNKKICDPAKLKVFKTLREQARRALQNVGLPLLGGYAVPLAEFDNVKKVLDDVLMKFESAKQDFLTSYDQAIQSWIADNPEDAALIRNGVKDVRDVADRIQGDYQVFQVAPMAVAMDGLERASGGMAGDLIQEVKEKVGKFYDNYIVKASTADRRTRSTFGALAKKVSGLAFLDSRFDALQRLLEETDALYDRNDGPIAGSDFQELRANALILSSDRIQDYLEKGAVDEDDWADISDADVETDATALEETTVEAAPATDTDADETTIDNDDPFAALDALLDGELFDMEEVESEVSVEEVAEPKPEMVGEAVEPEAAPASPEFVEEFVEELVDAPVASTVATFDPDASFEESVDENVVETYDW